MENRGQWPAKALFKADLTNGALYLTDSGLLFSLREGSAAEKAHSRSHEKFTYKGHAFYLHFKGASYAHVEQKQLSSEYYNYYLGPDPAHWKSGIHAASELVVHDLYPGIDLQLMEDNGTLKYNLICRQPENISLIRFQYLGVDGLEITEKKITVKTSLGNFIEAMPLVYGFGPDGTTQHAINAVYRMGEDNYFGFKLEGHKYAKVVIDPILVFSTYSGSPANNFGCTGTYDDLGNGFAGGTVFAIGLPTSVGAFQKTFGGGTFENLGYGDGRDAAILKFSPNGSNLLFGTYLGGNDNEQPHSMVTNARDELYVMGSTMSANFPIVGGTGKAHGGMYDFFIAHFSADGTQLLNSTFVGASQNDGVGADRGAEAIDNFPLLYNYADEFRGEIITDQNNIYVSGLTYSPGFPKSNNSTFFGGKEDAVLFCMPADLSKITWSEIIGSTGHEAFYGVALGKHGDIFAAGASTSADLPSKVSTFANAYIGGMADALLMRFDVKTGKRLNATFAGTPQYEQAYFVQTDNSGNPYIYGQTEGPVANVNAKFHMNATGQFIIRFDSLLSAVTLSSSFGTLGNRPNISPTAFLVDQCERIFISGWGGDANANLRDALSTPSTDKVHRNRGFTNNMPITADAAQKATDGSDFYLAVFSKGMNSLLYATYFGGLSQPGESADEHVDGGTSRFDKKGIIYQSVCAGCQDNSLFPTTASAYSRTNRSHCNNALFKIDFQNLNRVPTMKDTFIRVIATDPISYAAKATDTDVDSVFISWRWVNKGGANGADTPVISIQKGLQQATMSLAWNTKCSNQNTDTAIIEFMIWDQGCPKSDTSYARVKILILPPPFVVPPDAVCLSFDRGDKQLEISWPDMAPVPLKYFKYFLLKRLNPDNSVVVLDTIRDFLAGTFKDLGILDPVTNNYCYFIEGVNICDLHTLPIAPFCTVGELKNPINPVQINYVTVEMDRRVLVAWNQSNEPDLKDYELYKYKRGGTPGKTPVTVTKDTFFYDSFDVDFESWCYVILVTDRCGHVSTFSNPGCNVVISGTTVGRPDYIFNLAWQNYVGWNFGISDWEVERQYSSKPWSFLASTGKNQIHKDDQLDYYDWGGYWYRTNAISNPDSAGHVFRSQSNWIYLYQKPELWVPNCFTPDENGKNDQWGIVPVFVRNYSLKVYNRWGEKVWETTDRHAQWDGIANGKTSRDAVFAWKVEFDGWDDKTYKMTGTVILLH